MDGLVNIAGKRTQTFDLNGKTYTMVPKILADYAEREKYILSLKPHPLELLDQLPPLPESPPLPVPPDNLNNTDALKLHRDQVADYHREKARHDAAVARRERLEAALRREAARPQVVSFEDDREFDQSLHGIAFKLWRSIRENHPEIDGVQAALDLLEQMGEARLGEINNKLDLVDEKDILGNSSGSGGPSPGQAEFPGDTSTAPSVNGTDGPLVPSAS